MMKPVKEVKGKFVYEPKIGERCMIDAGDKYIWTSTVADIRNATTESVEIETQNTIYKVDLIAEKEKSIAA